MVCRRAGHRLHVGSTRAAAHGPDALPVEVRGLLPSSSIHNNTTHSMVYLALASKVAVLPFSLFLSSNQYGMCTLLGHRVVPP